MYRSVAAINHARSAPAHSYITFDDSDDDCIDRTDEREGPLMNPIMLAVGSNRRKNSQRGKAVRAVRSHEDSFVGRIGGVGFETESAAGANDARADSTGYSSPTAAGSSNGSSNSGKKRGCLYFVRHGESAANESNVYSGNVWDVELTAFGRLQAANGGKVVKGKGKRQEGRGGGGRSNG